MSVIDIIRIAAIGLSIIVILFGALLLLPGSNSILERFFKTDEPQFASFEELERTGKPNDYLACPEDFCENAEADEIVPVLDAPADALSAQVAGLADSSTNISLRSYDPERRLFAFVERTPTMRFPDLIWVQVVPVNDDQSTLAIYSRSVYGYSDVGMNKKRVKRWLAIIRPNDGPNA